MDTSFIIYAVIGLIIVSLVVTGIVQQREQIAIAKKQKATQYIYRSRNAEEMYEKINNQNINPEILQFILGLIVNNYKAAAKILPEYNNIQQLISRSTMQLNDFNPTVENETVAITDEAQLTTHVAKINRLYSYLKKQSQSASLSPEQFKTWGQQLKNQSHQFEIDGLIKLALRAKEAAMPGTAKNHLENIETKLKSYPLEAGYLAQRKADVKNLRAQLIEPSELKSSDEEQDPDEDKPLDEKTKW